MTDPLAGLVRVELPASSEYDDTRETAIRERLAAMAHWYASAPTLTDPRYLTITEGRTGKSYSSCEELAVALAWRIADAPPHAPWANRLEAGNRWEPGRNLARLINHAPHGATQRLRWHLAGPASAEALVRKGCAVQYWTRRGFLHTIVVLAPSSSTLWLIAEYGQEPGPPKVGRVLEIDGSNIVDGNFRLPIACVVDLAMFARGTHCWTYDPTREAIKALQKQPG